MPWWNRSSEGKQAHWDLAYPPENGGITKQILYGWLTAGGFVVLAVITWWTERTWLPGRRHGGVWVGGAAAQAAAICHAGIAMFFHARWFWGSRGHHVAFERLTVLAGLLIIGGLITTLVLALE